MAVKVKGQVAVVNVCARAETRKTRAHARSLSFAVVEADDVTLATCCCGGGGRVCVRLL